LNDRDIDKLIANPKLIKAHTTLKQAQELEIPISGQQSTLFSTGKAGAMSFHGPRKPIAPLAQNLILHQNAEGGSTITAEKYRDSDSIIQYVPNSTQRTTIPSSTRCSLGPRVWLEQGEVP
jgi:hypothetical protein